VGRDMGLRAVTARGAVCRPRRWLPKVPLMFTWTRDGQRTLLYHRPYLGLFVAATCNRGCAFLPCQHFPLLRAHPVPVRKPKLAAAAATAAAKIKPKSCLSHLTALIAHCSAVTFDDGSAREPGTLTIGSQRGVWRVAARDLANNCQVCVVDQDLDTALVSLDLLVGDQETPWEVMTWAKQRGKKRP
jgi:hypothetical protein